MSNRRLVNYIAQEEPAFITRFKNKIGFKEENVLDVNTKFAAKDEKISKKELIKKKMAEYNSDEDNEDSPQVVVLNNGDLTEEEAKKLHVKISDIEDEANGRILFKNSKKRAAPDAAGGSIKTSSVKRFKKEDDDGGQKSTLSSAKSSSLKSSPSRSSSSLKSTKLNKKADKLKTTLLSFDIDD